MRLAPVSASLALMLALAAFSYAEEKTAAPTTQPVNKYCIVGGERHGIDPNVTHEYKGKVYGFCCTDCRDDFKKDPEKYVPKEK